jgi:hypothetical protein
MNRGHESCGLAQCGCGFALLDLTRAISAVIAHVSRGGCAKDRMGGAARLIEACGGVSRLCHCDLIFST